ncbi:hypothetical protein [Thiohalomonas denitrificans]|uniref:Lipoprotein n=1 Tax=Thiohalomonas denitrificans TaxID=415747 RepID=A0A1G5PTK5_9GAMM|nr:hypothetical protein [Thiohalomonas denitrificans]SCZ52762.1 hypothetical protein SAMN03097708_00799 [Thiohalomonas denitrificans]
MVLRFLSVSLLVVITTACAQLFPAPSPDQPFYAPPKGSRLELLQPIPIPGNEVSVWIQQGRVIDYQNADRYQAFCKFEMWSKLDRPRTVQPDTFTVERVRRMDWAVRRDEPLRLAGVGVGGVGDDVGGPAFFIMSTEMFLDSPRQPDVHRLTCQHWEDARLPRHLTINEMRRTLQGIFDLELPEEPRQRD